MRRIFGRAFGVTESTLMVFFRASPGEEKRRKHDRS